MLNKKISQGSGYLVILCALLIVFVVFVATTHSSPSAAANPAYAPVEYGQGVVEFPHAPYEVGNISERLADYLKAHSDLESVSFTRDGDAGIGYYPKYIAIFRKKAAKCPAP